MTKRILSEDEAEYLETKYLSEDEEDANEQTRDTRRVKHQVKKKAKEIPDTIYNFVSDLNLLTEFVNNDLGEGDRKSMALQLFDRPAVTSTIADSIQYWTPDSRAKTLLLNLFNGDADWRDDGTGFTVDDIIEVFSSYISNIRFENMVLEEQRKRTSEALDTMAHGVKGKRFFQYEIGRGGPYIDSVTNEVYSFPNLLIETSKEALGASRWLTEGKRVWITYRTDPVIVERGGEPEAHDLAIEVNIPLMILRSNPAFYEDYASAGIDHPLMKPRMSKPIQSWEEALEELVRELESEPPRAILQKRDKSVKVVSQHRLKDKDFTRWYESEGYELIAKGLHFQSIIRKIKKQLKDPRGGATTTQKASIREMVDMGLFTKVRGGLRITRLGKEVNRLLENERFIRFKDN